MSHRQRALVVAVAAALTAACTTSGADTQSAPPSAAVAGRGQYLFAYFEGAGDGLHLAHSEDGLTWRALQGDRVLFRPTVGSERLLRDPSIVRADDGTYHMVWTTGWRERGFGYARSRDLLHWTDERFVPVMAHEPMAANTWAPELQHDASTGQYLVVWATTIPGRYPATDSVGGGGRYNHRLYYVATRDFATFTPTRLLYERGFSVIDATIVRDSLRYVMWLKDETERPPQKNIRLAFADRAEGPWSAPTAPITGDYWAEGPTVLRIGGRWHLYFDRYREHRYGLLVSDDLTRWTDATDRLRVPDGIRHGTAFEVPSDEARRLLAAEASGTSGRP
jgi:hypothetical protein